MEDGGVETPAWPQLSRVDGAVLPALGGFGRYQKRLVLLSWLPALLLSCGANSDPFLLEGRACVWNRTENGTGGGRPGLAENVVTEWRLVCEDAWRLQLLRVALLFGSTVGYLLGGVLADWLGRKPVMLVCVVSVCVCGVGVAFSSSLLMFACLRFVQGLSLAGIGLTLYLLRMELCLPAWRFSAMLVSSVLAVGGQLLMPGLATLCADWHLFQILLSSPLVLLLFYACLFPESLRWLLATRRFHRAKGQMYAIAQSNRVDTETDQSGVLSELERAQQETPRSSCVLQIIRTRNLWKSVLVLCVNALAGCGMEECFVRVVWGGVLPSKYLALGGVALAACVAMGGAVCLLGRRAGLLCFMIVTALCSLLQLGLFNLIGKYALRHGTVLRDNHVSVVFSGIGILTSHAVSSLSVFTCAEISPTVIRGGSVGLVMASATLGACVSPLLDHQELRGFFLLRVILTCTCLLSLICIPLLRETTGQPLPESIAEAEGLLRRPLPSGEQHCLLQRPEVTDTPLRQLTTDTPNGVRTS
ncbi:solute carrier family 22 member 23 isoform X2 [Denticeps clupeoides]|uniref:solute carrier family 22 member 23 isoform X2 n=1 Tax=Denticeps clupeoides TaxID=299321 RepID=UPI0010A48AFA|nr:solute carrier family 22 member 23-like isoform X2 [Denticeps clupeoides]